MAFADPTQAGQDQTLNPSQAQVAAQGQQSTQSPQPDSSAPPSTSAGGAGVAAGGSGGTPTAASSGTPKPSSSGSWTNLDSYLNANSDQAGQIGQQIAGSVNAKGQSAQGDINNLGTGFGQAVQSSTVQANPDAVNQAVNDATTLKAGQSLSGQDQQAFNQQASGAYNGPSDVTNFNGYSKAQQDISAANQAAQATSSEAGRASLLNNQFQNTSKYGYTQGENNLDQLLLQNSQGAQAALQPLSGQWAGLNGALNTTVNTGAQQVQGAQATNAATAAAAKNALGTANKNFQDQLSQGVTDLQAKDQLEYNQELQNLQTGKLGPADWQSLGIATAPDHIYGNNAGAGVNTASYLQQGNSPTLASYATADQYAQAAALAQLAGQGTNPFLSQSNVAQAGTASGAPAYTFNGSQFTSDNAAAKQNYTNTMNNVVSSLNSGLQSGMVSIPNGAGLSSAMLPANASPQDVYTFLQKAMQLAVGPQKDWAQQQLQGLNQVQTENGFDPFPAFGSVPSVGGTAPTGK